ncbi:MAG: DUF2892 domain-containing protein [Pseudomonadota bacterium]
MLKKNIGGFDRVARVAVGLALIAAFFIGPAGSYSWLFLLGIVPLATGLLSRCPVYSLIGVSTCPTKQS